MNEIKIIPPNDKHFNYIPKKYYQSISSKSSNKKGLFRVLSAGNINNSNYSKNISIYENHSVFPSLINAKNNSKIKIKKNILNSNSKKNHYKIEIEKLNDQNSNYRKTILKLQSELYVVKSDINKKENILNSMNDEIQDIINENEDRFDLENLPPFKLEEKNKFILIKKMKNKIKEAQQELKEEIDRNQYLKKNSKYTKFQELQLENMILNQQNDKMSLLIQNSNELKNKQNNELNQNKIYNNNFISQKNLINIYINQFGKLSKEEKYLQSEILKYENILNKTNERFKIIKLKQITLQNQNTQLNREKKEFNEKSKKEKKINKDEYNNYSLDKLKKKLSKAKNEYNYNKLKNKKTTEKLNNIKKNYNFNLDQYKKIENKLNSEQINNINKNIIIAQKINNEEKINELKKIYQENRDKEIEFEQAIFSYQEAIQRMNNGEEVDIEGVKNNILQVIKKYYPINDINDISSNNNKIDDDKNSMQLYYYLTLSKDNPYYTDSKENDPSVSEKFTNEQFRHFTYVLFKSFESKKINYEKGKKEIIFPLINYYNTINEDKSEDNKLEDCTIQEKLSKKFSEIILKILNCGNEQDNIKLKIFFNAIYYDKSINTENKDKISFVTDYFLSLFNYIHEYTPKDEEILKERIMSKYSASFLRLKQLFKDCLNSKNEKNNNYLSIEEIKYILDNNPDIRLKERYIEYIIYHMKQYTDDKASLYDLKISNLDDFISIDEKEKNEEKEKKEEKEENDKNKENQTTESIEEVSPEDYNKNIYSVLVIIKQLMLDEKKDIRQLFSDSIVTITKPNSDVITLDSFNDELIKRKIKLNYLQLSCINNKYSINEELHALDIKKIEEDINNLNEKEINNYL